MKNNNIFKVNKAQLNFYKVTISTLFDLYLKNCNNEDDFNLACKAIECLALYFKSKAYENGISFEEFLVTKIS